MAVQTRDVGLAERLLESHTLQYRHGRRCPQNAGRSLRARVRKRVEFMTAGCLPRPQRSLNGAFF